MFQFRDKSSWIAKLPKQSCRRVALAASCGLLLCVTVSNNADAQVLSAAHGHANPAKNVVRPDFFGSVALAIGKTPLDAKWAGVRADKSIPVGAASIVAKARQANGRTRIQLVNAWVNESVRYVEDAKNFGSTDLWATASMTMRTKRGDCEDFALLKMRILEAAGVPSDSMYLVIMRDLVVQVDHAVLVASSDEGSVVLDNRTNNMVDAWTASGYRPVFTFSARGRWTHGYARA